MVGEEIVGRTENKTKPTKVSPAAFIAKIANEQQRKDCRALTKLFRELTGKPAKMWGPTIVGFGAYHYVYPSGREGDAPLIGFAPRKGELVIYLWPGLDKKLKAELGKHKSGVACLYIKTLDGIDLGVLKRLAKASIAEVRQRYP
jgi:Domain of unknown function (DU1801)